MAQFDVAAQAVAEALRTGQIGTPVAARVVAALTADHGRIERQLARILEACAEWLGSRPDQLTAFGGVEVGQVSVLARFETGFNESYQHTLSNTWTSDYGFSPFSRRSANLSSSFAYLETYRERSGG